MTSGLIASTRERIGMVRCLDTKTLLAANDIKPNGMAYGWESTGGDPQLIVPASTVAQHILLRFSAVIVNSGSFPGGKFQLFFDRGGGFNEADSYVTYFTGPEIKIDTIVSMGGAALCFRLDPVDRPCEFVIQEFTIEPCGALEATLRNALRSVQRLYRKGQLGSQLVHVGRSILRGKFSHALGLIFDFSAPSHNHYARFVEERPLQAITHFVSRQPGEDAILRWATELARKESREMPFEPSASMSGPLISFVVPVYNTLPRYLDDLLTSFAVQDPRLCELVLSDDGSTSKATLAWLAGHGTTPRVIITCAASNGGIACATNSGLAVSTGEWVALLDHDDAIAPFAAERIARALASHPACQFLYTDEVVTDGELRPIANFLKPAWDEVLLSGVNYINHFSIYRRERLLEIGGLQEGFQGSQDYDLLLRYTKGLDDSEIIHLPYPAYLWRRDGASYSAQFLESATANARRALGARFATGENPAIVGPAITEDLHRVDFSTQKRDWPLVSVVIPSRDSFALISQLLEGLTTGTDYPAIEIIIIDNGTRDPEVLLLYEQYRSGQDQDGAVPFRAEVSEEPFNFSRAVNRGIALAKGELVLLLNNDIEVQESGWLKEMVACFDYPKTGVVGAKLLFPDRSLQHVGVIAGLGGLAGHWFIGQDRLYPGPMGRFNVRQSMSVVTGACLLVSRKCLDAVGAFDEEAFAIAYNDVDFCLRCVKAGFRVVWTPFSELIHHESASRGSDETPQNISRFHKEQGNLRERHHTDIFEDRAFNPWYTKDRSAPGFASCTQLPLPR